MILPTLDNLYHKYNKREFVHPDPLEFLYRYDDLPNREIVGFIAAITAFGNVIQILKSIENVLLLLQPSPINYLRQNNPEKIQKDFNGFYHRWLTGNDMAQIIIGLKKIYSVFPNLKSFFLVGYKDTDQDLTPSLTLFFDRFMKQMDKIRPGIIPNPQKSPAKRLQLFLRWMVRKDEVDPGGWDEISPSKLLMPLDTHVFNICKQLKLTKCKQPSMKCLEEIMQKFKKINPADPVKYDFVITRFGLSNQIQIKNDIKSLLKLR